MIIKNRKTIQLIKDLRKPLADIEAWLIQMEKNSTARKSLINARSKLNALIATIEDGQSHLTAEQINQFNHIYDLIAFFPQWPSKKPPQK